MALDVRFGLQIRLVVIVGLNDHRLTLNLKAKSLQGIDLLRIVRQESNPVNLHFLQYFCCHLIGPRIFLVTSRNVGFICIHACVLKIVGFKLFYESNSPSFLSEVNQYAPNLTEMAQCRRQLIPAIAASTAKYIPRHALAVNSYRNKLTREGFKPAMKGHMWKSIPLLTIGRNDIFTPFAWKSRLRK